LKSQLTQHFEAAVRSLIDTGELPAGTMADIRFERTRQKSHGDLATNIALNLAKPARRAPRELAGAIIAVLPPSPYIDHVEIAGPGFINIFLKPAAQFAVVPEIRSANTGYGKINVGAGQSVLIEFVSANPTGPLHVGHGRGAAYGDTLARILRAAGFDVATEYYVNDAGRQMDILAVSVWLRYLELCGDAVSFPDNAYRGDYVYDIAAGVHRADGDQYRRPIAHAMDLVETDDEEARLDALIDRAKNLLGEQAYARFFDAALTTLVDDIRDDLEQFNVTYDRWFSERSLYSSNALGDAVDRLKASQQLYQREGAWWFRSTSYGDEKDRVVVRDNGVPTYFAADIAYHADKYARGYARLIDIWGADHHGYAARVKGSIAALGYDPEQLTIMLVQFAILYRGEEKISMSTRAGEFVTLRELRREVGTDAARFFYVQRKPDQHMDFDLELAKSQSNDNPVYYVQYAHARVRSVFKQAAERGVDLAGLDRADLAQLREDHEIDLAATLNRFPEVVQAAAQEYAPHHVTYYLREVANALHTYYNAHRILDAEPALRTARLALIDATRIVIANGLSLLGVGAPDQM